MRRVALITTSRADWGIYRPLARRLEAHPELELALVAGGAHLAPELGLTVREIEAEGFAPAARVECLDAGDDRLAMARGLGRAAEGFAAALDGLTPDMAVVLGDRFEMFAAAAAAAALGLPLAHLYGGELTYGAVDELFRHAMTKLSHLHFTATGEYARRVVQMGEEPWRVTVCGALGLDNLEEMELLDRPALEAELGLALEPAPLLVTMHPETATGASPGEQLAELLAALEAAGRPVIFTLPNADAGGRETKELIQRFCRERPWARVRDNLGSLRYFSLMRHAAAMVGNSSSGVIEAPSLGLPVVNLGSRQEGRVRAANLVDCPVERGAIGRALKRALAPEFRAGLAGLANPYRARQGGAAGIIARRLARADLGEGLLVKRFHDLEPGPTGW